MSSTAASGGGGGGGGGGAGDGDRRQSFTKFMTRAKSALKRDKTKRLSSSGDASAPETPSGGATSLHSSAAAAAARPTEREPVETIPEQEAKVGKAEKQPETKKAEVGDKTEAEKLEKRVTNRAALQQEKARALFEKYGLTLEPHEWATPSTADRVERVQKPIRMRVHRTCHRCQTTFGVDKVCVQCGHKRCKTCPRYPVKKPKHAQQEPGKVAGIAAAGEKDGLTREERRLKAERKYRVTMPAKVQTQDRVRRDVRQRVHRTCHRCERQFERGEKTCAACTHIRCTKCPRDPAKPHKYPDGYPGDAEAVETDEIIPAVRPREFKKTRMIVKWHCHSCDAIFLHGNKTCRSCQHQRCRECRRVPPKKVKPPPTEPDSALMERIEARLADMRLDPGGQKDPAAPARLIGQDTSQGPPGRADRPAEQAGTATGAADVQG